MRAMHNMLTFDGLMAQDMCLNFLRNVETVRSFDSEFIIAMPSAGRSELSCDVVVFPYDACVIDSMIEKLWRHNYNLVNLGAGYVCEYCGEYKVAGELKCHRCGGMTQKEKFATVSAFPFILIEYGINQPYDELITVRLNMRSTGPIDSFVLERLSNGITLETLPHTMTLDQSKYLCEFCGMIVESGKSCPGCGGTRLPWSEIVKMDHECLYCGKRVTSGIVCRSCGARLSGLSYRMVKGKWAC